MPRFSIIIPIFNSAESINKCLESIHSQCFSDYEVLLIDDGSTDASLQICKQWKEHDGRIHVFHQDNKGASSARNMGLMNAIGEYVQFVDSDDTIEPNCLERINALIQEYHDPDIVEFRLNYIGPSGIRNIQGCPLAAGLYDRSFIEDTFLPVMLQIKPDDQVYYNIFNVLRIIKRKLISSYSIMFNPNIKRWEDWLFAMEIYNRVQQMVVTNDALYNYFGHEGGGLGGRYDPNTFRYVIEAYRTMDNLMGEKYEMFCPYAVRQKVTQFERCIREIYAYEPSANQKHLLMEILHDDYFAKVICSAKSNRGILIIRPFIQKGKHTLALRMLCMYLSISSLFQSIRRKLSWIYHMCLKEAKANE